MMCYYPCLILSFSNVFIISGLALPLTVLATCQSMNTQIVGLLVYYEVWDVVCVFPHS